MYSTCQNKGNVFVTTSVDKCSPCVVKRKTSGTKDQHVIFPPKVCALHLSSVESTVVKPTPPTIVRMTPGNDPFETQTKVLREFPANRLKHVFCFNVIESYFCKGWFMFHAPRNWKTQLSYSPVREYTVVLHSQMTCWLFPCNNIIYESMQKSFLDLEAMSPDRNQ